MSEIMAGKTCLVTGANSGIGKALCIGLAGYGANVIMVCRDPGRGQAASEEIKELTKNPHIDLLLIDLASQESIRNGVLEFKKKYNKLHVLINNAGALFFKKTLTSDGMEATLAVNYLAPFLLTNLLLDVLMSGAPSRIINVSSEAQKKAHIDFTNLAGEKKYSPMIAYSQAKLACILFTQELARRLSGTGVSVNCFYPEAVVRTNLGNADKGFFKYTFKLMSLLLSPLFITPAQAAKTGVYLAVSEKIADVSGRCYVQNRQATSAAVLNRPYDQTVAEKLWQVSEELTGLSG